MTTYEFIEQLTYIACECDLLRKEKSEEVVRKFKSELPFQEGDIISYESCHLCRCETLKGEISKIEVTWRSPKVIVTLTDGRYFAVRPEEVKVIKRKNQ